MRSRPERQLRKAVDRRIWDREIEGFVPERVFDTHVHLMK